MNSIMSELVQTSIIAILLGWSVFFMLRRMLPNVINRQQQRLAQMAQTHGYIKLSKWLEPQLKSGGGCGSGCSNCSSCASNPTAAQEQIVQWKKPSSKSSGCH
jgi:hypothetical protein